MRSGRDEGGTSGGRVCRGRDVGCVDRGEERQEKFKGKVEQE